MGVKLKQREGKGWWVFTNWKGQRKAKSFGKNKALAKEFKETLEAKWKLGSIGIESKAGVKFEDYAETWLEWIRYSRKLSTYEDYVSLVNRELLPAFRGLDLEDITREKVKALAFGCLKRGLSPKTVQNLIRALSCCLGYAVEDEKITVNPALKPGKFLPSVTKDRAINPLTREEVALVLEKAKQRTPRYYPLFLCAVRTGLRQGELIGLQWGDIDFHGRFLEVRRNYARGKLTTPKNGKTRKVDMSLELTKTLRDLHTERQLEAVANGWAEVPLWIFCNEEGKPLHHNHLRKGIFYRLLKAAGLRQVRFHDLRHSFASLLLQQGESPVHVKEQMGHSSIQMTVDLYGKLIPGGNKQAVDRLDTPVDKEPFQAENATQAQPIPVGGGSGH